VHRDVKPENVFIEHDGQIKMLDFGLARSFDGTPVLGRNASDAHLVVGTPHYSQPEQLRTRVLTPASDVYSLGLILYELLSARAPYFPGRTLAEVKYALRNDPAQWLKAHATAPVVRLDEQPGCEDLPPALVKGIHRALEKDPARRPPDAGALANILGLVLHRDMGIPVAATLRVLHPDKTMDDRLFLPGSYRIGSGARCEIKLRDDHVPGIHAVLEWSGVPNRPHLRPLTDDRSVRVNDHLIDRPVELGENDEFSVGATRLAVVI
jgi:serine/threonine protein kinase